jgi:CBS domain-containing protein
MQIPSEWDEAHPGERSRRVAFLHEPLSSLTLRKPVCVPPDTPARAAIRLMNDERIGAVMVTADERLVGMFTERDVLKKIVGGSADIDAPVRELMTPSPSCLRLEDAIVFALKLMHEGGFRHVPLIDERGRPAALVSVKDAVEFLVTLFAKEYATAPPAPRHLAPSSSEGA